MSEERETGLTGYDVYSFDPVTPDLMMLFSLFSKEKDDAVYRAHLGDALEEVSRYREATRARNTTLRIALLHGGRVYYDQTHMTSLAVNSSFYRLQNKVRWLVDVYDIKTSSNCGAPYPADHGLFVFRAWYPNPRLGISYQILSSFVRIPDLEDLICSSPTTEAFMNGAKKAWPSWNTLYQRDVITGPPGQWTSERRLFRFETTAGDRFLSVLREGTTDAMVLSASAFRRLHRNPDVALKNPYMRGAKKKKNKR